MHSTPSKAAVVQSARQATSRGPSIADVAQLAGVSGQTVSRVANGSSLVGASTRERVQAAMEQVGYRPNRAARALRSGRFATIGIVASSVNAIGNARTVDAIVAAAGRAGYSVSLTPIEYNREGEMRSALGLLEGRDVDGIILSVGSRHPDQDLATRLSIPTVVVGTDSELPVPRIDSDQSSGASQAVEYLLSLGHETVWHVTGHPEAYAAIRRRDAWSATLLAHGIAAPPSLEGDWTASSGYQAGLQLAADPSVTAIFAANDHMAFGVLRALHEAGRRVPEEVSVIGYDDVDEAEYAWPPLTTIHQDFTAIGIAAVERLVRLIETLDPEPLLSPLVEPKLVARASTAQRRAL